MREHKDTITEIPEHEMRILLTLGMEFGFDPVSCEESRRYFAGLLSKHQEANEDERVDRLRSIIAKDFTGREGKPRWLRHPAWPFVHGRPMLFVGQLELCYKQSSEERDVIYVFRDQATGLTRTIVQ